MTTEFDRIVRDADTDPLMSLATAANLVPGEQPGRGVSPSTVFRWGMHGVSLPDGRRVKLRMWRVGRKWLTTRGALAEFIEAQQPEERSASTTPRPPAQRRRASEAAAGELRDAGV